MSEIIFSATLNKVSTSRDGGWVVTLDVPENNSAMVHQLSALRDSVLVVTAALDASSMNDLGSGLQGLQELE
jgi:hypothetical protein